MWRRVLAVLLVTLIQVDTVAAAGPFDLTFGQERSYPTWSFWTEMHLVFQNFDKMTTFARIQAGAATGENISLGPFATVDKSWKFSRVPVRVINAGCQGTIRATSY
jgi:hypothetical protein